MRLAEKRITLPGGPEVRQIRRLLDSRQVPLVTTDMHTPMERVWARCSRAGPRRASSSTCARRSASTPVHGLVEQDPAARVPDWRRCDRRIRQRRQKLGTLRNRVADLLRGAPSDIAVTAAGTLKDEIVTLGAEHEALKVRRSETPKHVTVAELDERLDALPSSEKLLLDIVRMTACRAEARMMSAVAAAQGAKQRPRRPLAELFRSDADIIPDPENGVLRVRILGTASNARDADIAGLLDGLNWTRTIFPGTGLRMIHELADNARKPGP